MVCKRKYLLPFIWTLAFILVPVLTVTAGDTGKIAGQVYDAQSEEPLVGANVVVEAQWIDGEEVELTNKNGASTDMEGFYYILNLRPGKYTVACYYIGYVTSKRTMVEVYVDKTTAIDFALGTEALIGDEIVVEAYKEKPVEVDLTATKQVYDIESVEAIAGVNDITDILQLQADVVDDHFRGGRVGEAQYVMGAGAIVNPLDNNRAFKPIVTGLDQVEVYTSGFSAEYGNAQSGVVNMVPKEGSNVWSSRLEVSSTLPYYKTFGGSIYETGKHPFWGLLDNDEEWLKENPDNPGRPLYDWGYGFGPQYLREPNVWPPDPLTRDDSLHIARLGQNLWYQMVRDMGMEYNNTLDYRYDFSSGGPITDNVRLFLAARRETNNPVVPTPQVDFENQLMANLTYQPDVNNKYKFSFFYNNEFENDIGSNWLRWMFDRTLAVSKIDNTSLQFGLEYKHVFSQSTYMDLKASLLDLTSRERVDLLQPGEFIQDYRDGTNWKDISNSPSDHQLNKPADDFGDEDTQTWSFHGSVTSQVNNNNLIQVGLQYIYYDVRVDRSLNVSDEGAYRDVIFNVFPYEGALYVQDKMEFAGLIANLGLRYDFYNLQTNYYSNPYSPLYNREANKESELFTRLQPRIGVSFPVSESSVFHINYGTFTQRPNFNQLFFDQYDLHGTIEVLGNPDLKPERTQAYDFGIVQGLGGGLRLDVSAYYKDVKNLVEAAYYRSAGQDIYQTYINRDYADIKGFHVSLEKIEGSIRGFVRYNYESATGKSSTPLDAPVTYFETPDPVEGGSILPDPEDIFLDYDRTHKALLNLRYRTAPGAGLSIAGFKPFERISISGTFRYMTGRPYTYDTSGKGLEFNQRSPIEQDLRIRLQKSFDIANTDMNIYVEAFNVLNEKEWHYSRTFNNNRNTPRWHQDRDEILIYKETPPYYTNQSVYLLNNEPRHYRLGVIFKF